MSSFTDSLYTEDSERNSLMKNDKYNFYVELKKHRL